MNKSPVKRLLGLAGLVVGAVFALLLTARVGVFIESATTGADPEASLSLLEVPVDADVITWLPNAELARPLEATVRDEIGEAYLLGLDILDGSVEVSPDEYAVHLTGAALSTAQTLTSPQSPSRRSHTMRVTFYSADGQVVEVEDATASAFAAAGRIIARSERSVAVLVLVDGVWHLRHRVVTELETEVISAQ